MKKVRKLRDIIKKLNLTCIQRKRLILSILIPWFILSVFLFPPNERVDLNRFKANDNSTLVKVTPEEAFKPSLRNILADVLQIPLELKWYKICFLNNGTKNIYGNNVYEDYNINVTVDFNKGQQLLDVPIRKEVCVPYQFDKEFTYQWGFDISIDFHKVSMVEPKITRIDMTHYLIEKNVRMDPDVISYAKPEPKSLIVKYFLLLIAWGSLILLYSGIRKFILSGADS